MGIGWAEGPLSGRLAHVFVCLSAYPSLAGTCPRRCHTTSCCTPDATSCSTPGSARELYPGFSGMATIAGYFYLTLPGGSFMPRAIPLTTRQEIIRRHL